MESPTPSHRLFRFGLFELDPANLTLLRQGQRVRIQEQPLRLLLALVEHPSVIVTREVLRQCLWPEDTFVEFDQGLGTAVAKLRQALSDDADNPRFVETVPKRGFRFIAPVTIVEPLTPSAAPAPPNRTDLPTASPSPSATQLPGRGSRSIASWTFAGVLLLGAVSILLWYSRQSHPTPKLGERDFIVLADFTNHTGDPAFDDTLQRALSISLAQSPVLNILPHAEIAQTLRNMERSPQDSLSGATALEVCQRAGGHALVAGSISALGSKFVVGLDATDCQSGAVFAREQRDANRKEDVLDSLGNAGTSLRGKLGESIATLQKFDVPLQQATTSSMEALKAYSTGWKVRDEYGDAAALPYVEHATELDPNFALAYGLLAQIYETRGDDGLGAANAQKAYVLRAKVTEPEFFALTNFYLNFVRGDREAALQNCELWAATYPRDRVARVCLFFATEYVGRYEKSLQYGLDCIHVDPQAALCYGDLIWLYGILGRLSDAKATYDAALARGLNHQSLHESRYGIAFLESDAAEMSRQLAWSTGKPGAESDFLGAEADTQAFFGRLTRAEGLSARAIDAATRQGDKGLAARLTISRALREALFGEAPASKRDVAAALSLSPYPFIQQVAAECLALTGDTNQAEKIAAKQSAEHPVDTMLRSFWLPSIQATVALQHRQPDKAVEILTSAEPFERGEHVPLLPAYLRGQAYLALHQGPAAIREFQKLTNSPGLTGNSAIAALARLNLARAYAECAKSSHSSQSNAPRKQALTDYDEFLSQWKDADPTLPPLQQAKSERAKL